ncbi:hypothetical protein [Rheinheimera sp.]|uniref:hypothetical protein n=1 Tax=Rheinheimera sp. TaxID=1869214 RepID=UPI00307CD971
MSEDKSKAKSGASRLGWTAEEAAGAAIAQSLSLAAQNEVDAFRNQNTVTMVAMGVAYAKWLQNPLLGAQYSELVQSASLDTQAATTTLAERLTPAPEATSKTASDAKFRDRTAADAPAEAKASRRYTLPDQVFQYFLSPRQDDKG